MTTTLTAFDIVVLLTIGFMALGGAMRGFVAEALRLLGWIAAVIAVRVLHEPLTALLTQPLGGEDVAAIVAFLTLFFGTIIVAGLLAGAVGGATRASLLGPIDRALGLGFGAVKGLIAASALFLLVQFALGVFRPADRVEPVWFANAATRPMLATTSAAMVDFVEGYNRPAGRDAAGYADRDRDALEGAFDRLDRPRPADGQ